MNPLVISCIVFACVFAGALLGLFLQGPLPDHHLSDATKDVVKLGTGLIATLAALVLGLLIASAKNAAHRSRHHNTEQNSLPRTTISASPNEQGGNEVSCDCGFHRFIFSMSPGFELLSMAQRSVAK
jgi:hypothetical protein